MLSVITCLCTSQNYELLARRAYADISLESGYILIGLYRLHVKLTMLVISSKSDHLGAAYAAREMETVAFA